MEHLNDLCGKEFIGALDPFWEQWNFDIVIISP